MDAEPEAAIHAARIPGGRDGRRMLLITFVDRIGSGLWAAVSVLYFTYVSGLSVAQIGTLAAVSGAVGIVSAPLGGRIADRFPLTRTLIALQLLRAVASFGLLTSDHYLPLLAISAAGSLGDRASSVLTKLYAARIAGPDRVRYQAVNRTASSSRLGPGRPRRHAAPSPSAPPPPTAGSSPATRSPSWPSLSSP